jgi:hypothetical protein
MCLHPPYVLVTQCLIKHRGSSFLTYFPFLKGKKELSKLRCSLRTLKYYRINSWSLLVSGNKFMSPSMLLADALHHFHPSFDAHSADRWFSYCSILTNYWPVLVTDILLLFWYPPFLVILYHSYYVDGNNTLIVGEKMTSITKKVLYIYIYINNNICIYEKLSYNIELFH